MNWWITACYIYEWLRMKKKYWGFRFFVRRGWIWVATTLFVTDFHRYDSYCHPWSRSIIMLDQRKDLVGDSAPGQLGSWKLRSHESWPSWCQDLISTWLSIENFESDHQSGRFGLLYQRYTSNHQWPRTTRLKSHLVSGFPSTITPLVLQLWIIKAVNCQGWWSEVRFRLGKPTTGNCKVQRSPLSPIPAEAPGNDVLPKRKNGLEQDNT